MIQFGLGDHASVAESDAAELRLTAECVDHRVVTLGRGHLPGIAVQWVSRWSKVGTADVRSQARRQMLRSRSSRDQRGSSAVIRHQCGAFQGMGQVTGVPAPTADLISQFHSGRGRVRTADRSGVNRELFR